MQDYTQNRKRPHINQTHGCSGTVKEKWPLFPDNVKPEAEPIFCNQQDIVDGKLEPEQSPDFNKMKVTELKEFVQKHGVPVSAYKKADPVLLARSYDMDASAHPDFRDDSIEQTLEKRLTLPAGKIVADPLKFFT